ncbi:MAG TPA: 3-deoxy-manno-octulosonate cytidylyltransferase [Terriglobia bacterium]|nr:3-deoxy-manno-octulosonate cytidylyltransferase [Terriglobia bacterium]
MSKVVGVIPVRLESTRLPRKALRLIAGHSMLEWVYRRARECRGFSSLLVATDSEEVLAHCRDLAIPAMMTSSEHRSGTERIVEVMGREPADVYVNIQGDEPMVIAGHIELMLAPFGERAGTQVSTLKVALSAQEAGDPNNVKVVTDVEGRALYFSRAVVPYDRAGAGRVQYYKHLGFYAYSRAALEKFSRLPVSQLEIDEGLEQLRYLYHGVPIVVAETRLDTVGVDSEEDLAKVEQYFREGGIGLPPR